MKKFVIFIIFFLYLATGVIAYTDAANKTSDVVRDKHIADTIVKNKLFAVTIPGELKGFYEIKKEKDKISVFHKESKKAGFGGFAFGIKAYKNPSDHAEMPGGKKIGELKDKRGQLYDMVLKYPTDVQYDYTKNVKSPESYKQLYDLGAVVSIVGVKGSTYFKNQGMKGEDLYNNILKKHLTAINENWDSTKLEEENKIGRAHV